MNQKNKNYRPLKITGSFLLSEKQPENNHIQAVSELWQNETYLTTESSFDRVQRKYGLIKTAELFVLEKGKTVATFESFFECNYLLLERIDLSVDSSVSLLVVFRQ